MKKISILTILLTIVIISSIIACSEDDIGKDCTLPTNPTSCSNNMAFNDIASDCLNHWCLSYLGSAGFCSKTCISNSDCPSGFRCLKGFTSLDPELKDTSFCVPKQNLECIAGTVDAGTSTTTDAGE
ncbi:MAG: hypothetical protein ACP5KG_04090 [Myxococcota bacterium]